MRIAPRHSVYTSGDPQVSMLQIPRVHGEAELAWNCIPADVTDRKNDGARATRGSRVKIGSVSREWRLPVTDVYRHGKRYGSESCPCARRQPRVPGRIRREERKWRRRSSLSSRIFLIPSQQRYFNRADWSILWSSPISYFGPLNASRRFLCRVIVNIIPANWLRVVLSSDVKYCDAFRPDASLPFHVPSRRPAQVVSTLTRRYFVAISWFRCSRDSPR